MYVLMILPGGMETFLIIFAIILLFGGRKIPGLMKGIGEGIRNFKDAKKGNDRPDDTKD